MIDAKCRICRRAGEKLFLKGEKCFTPKCVFNKKPYAPGSVAASGGRRRSNVSEYGRQLREKQKVRNTYGVKERQFLNYTKKATSLKGKKPSDTLFTLLETRLDNAVFRSGLAPSRSLARQMVSHGHITVNNKKVDIPSHSMKKGDVFAVRDGSKNKVLFTEIIPRLKKHKTPSWISFTPETLSGEITELPKATPSEISFDLASVVEFYSR